MKIPTLMPMLREQSPPFWRISPDRALTLDRPRLIGILNVTPDSFSDGGKYVAIDAAVNAAMRMIEEGACIIDIGGESTRPGAAAVTHAEQVRRTVPVITALREHLQSIASQAFISIDTTRAEVADAALNAGADIINDTSAGRDDDQMLNVVAAHQCGYILMHRRKPPIEDEYSDLYAAPPDYRGDVVGFVRDFLDDRCQIALEHDRIARESLVIDPGLGFGKSVEQNYELIQRAGELMSLGFPMLSAASRKSFIGAVTGETEPAQRVMGSVAVSLAHYASGVRLFRVHDVAAHAQALAVATAIEDTARARTLGTGGV